MGADTPTGVVPCNLQTIQTSQANRLLWVVYVGRKQLDCANAIRHAIEVAETFHVDDECAQAWVDVSGKSLRFDWGRSAGEHKLAYF